MRVFSFALAVALLPLTLPLNAVAAEKSASGIETSHISEEFVAAWIAHPRQFLKSKVIQQSIAEWDKVEKKETSAKLFAKAQQELGVDPRKVEQIVMLMDRSLVLSMPAMMGIRSSGPGGPGGGPAAGGRPPTPIFSFIVRFSEPVDQKAVTRAAIRMLREAEMGVSKPRREKKAATDDATKPRDPLAETTTRKFAGKTYRVLDSMGLCFVNDKTLLVSHESLLKQMIAAKDVKSPLLKRLATLPKQQDAIFAAEMKPFATVFAAFPREFLPVDVQKLFDYVSKTRTLAFTAGLSGETVGFGMAEMPDKASATGFAKLLNDKFLPLITKAWASERENLRNMKKPIPRFAVKLYDQLLDGTAVVAKGESVVLSIRRPKELENFPKLARPVIKAQREAEERSARKNALKQIGLAMHNYHDVHKTFPGHGSSGDGAKKGLSWRVHILPYVGQHKLYKEFKLDEAWDSKHNKKLIAKMPEVFKTQGVKEKEKGKTSIHVFIGKGTPFGRKTGGPRIADILDGTSNTILAVEAGPDKADVWTKPGGLPFDPKGDPIKALGKLEAGGFHGLLMDGSVRFISQHIGKTTLKRLIQHADRMPVGGF